MVGGVCEYFGESSLEAAGLGGGKIPLFRIPPAQPPVHVSPYARVCIGPQLWGEQGQGETPSSQLHVGLLVQQSWTQDTQYALPLGVGDVAR